VKLVNGIIVSGAALSCALLLCMVIKSQAFWIATWSACMAYALTVLGTVLYLAIERSTDKLEDEIRRRIER
jgi:CHASE2 domain-containing sensor protein